MARAYFAYRKATEKIHPRYLFGCPSECAEHNYDRYRVEKCEDCPLKDKDRFFERETIKDWRLRLGKNWQKFRFNEVKNILFTVMQFETVNRSKLSVKNNYLLNIFLSERNFYDAKERYEQNQN